MTNGQPVSYIASAHYSYDDDYPSIIIYSKAGDVLFIVVVFNAAAAGVHSMDLYIIWIYKIYSCFFSDRNLFGTVWRHRVSQSDAYIAGPQYLYTVYFADIQYTDDHRHSLKA